METAYNSLKTSGQNNVDGVVNLMKNAGILGPDGQIEEYVRALFGSSGKVKYEQFQGVMAEVAKSMGMQMDQLGGQLIASPMFNTTGANVEMEDMPSLNDNPSSESYEDYNSGETEADDQDENLGDDEYDDN